MFVETIRSKAKSGKIYETHLVRESVRTPQGPRSLTLCNITKLPAEIRQLIAAALKGQAMVPAESISLHSALDFGGLAVLRDAWARFGLAQLFASMEPVHAGRLQAIVFSRLLFPSAKLALGDRARGTALAAACGLAPDEEFDKEDLYAAMDQLNGRWSPLIAGLYGKAFPEKVRVALYDITSVYFEGKGPAGLARYGHSRDHRADRPQINLAVVTDESGMPISLSVLRGNRADNKTLLGLLKILKRRFGITEATFVFDGGMSGEINLKAMDEAGLKYITRLSNSTLDSLIKQNTEAAAELAQMELGDKPRLIEIERDGRRYVLAGGAWRAQRDSERRLARLIKGEKILIDLAAKRRKQINTQKIASTVGRALEKAKAHKYFNYDVDADGTIRWSRKESVIEEEKSRDGWYLLHTNLTAENLDKEGVLAGYKGLLEVEDAFRELKTYLEVRPIYHYRPDRVVNHVRLCFLSYWISARLGREWGLCGEHREVTRVLRSLQTIRVGVLGLGGETQRQVMTSIPDDIGDTLKKTGLFKLFSTPPSWVNPLP